MIQYMTLPNNVRIAGFDYQIKYEDAKGMPEMGLQFGQELCGCIQQKEQHIVINNEYTVDRQKETILHEIVHGIVSSYNVPVTEKQHEDVVTGISSGLFQVLNDNPDIINMFVRSSD
jgi:hypothetical protein